MHLHVYMYYFFKSTVHVYKTVYLYKYYACTSFFNRDAAQNVVFDSLRE